VTLLGKLTTYKIDYEKWSSVWPWPWYYGVLVLSGMSLALALRCTAVLTSRNLWCTVERSSDALKYVDYCTVVLLSVPKQWHMYGVMPPEFWWPQVGQLFIS